MRDLMKIEKRRIRLLKRKKRMRKPKKQFQTMRDSLNSMIRRIRLKERIH
jgi:hypothetical protein